MVVTAFLLQSQYKKKPEQNLCCSTKDHGKLRENIPFNVQIMGCCQFQDDALLCYSKRGGIVLYFSEKGGIDT